MVFEDFNLCDAVRRGVEETGFNKPTLVQKQVIPLALEGRDLLVFAETGTGKTAAYGLPVLERLSQAMGLSEDKKKKKTATKTRTTTRGRRKKTDEAEKTGDAEGEPQLPGALHALILGPTREVVTRSEGSLRSFGVSLPVRIRAIFGGVPAAPQREALRRGLHVVSATPGRLAEILRQEDLPLDKVQLLVLDEIDHLAQMNLMKEVNSIVERLPKERQTLVFANKRTPEVEALAQEFLRDPQIVEIPRLEAPMESLEQTLYPVESNQKNDLLLAIMGREAPRKAVVFFRTRRNVDRVQPLLEQQGRKVAALHADRTPAQRQQAIEAFSAGEANTLVATEMAVRSLEVEGITHLINYDLPQFPDDYVNRIARCSQTEPVEKVISLVSPEDRDSLRRLEKHLGKVIERVKIPEFAYEDRGRRSVDRILAASTGESRGPADRSEPGRRGRRPLRPLPPAVERKPEATPAERATSTPPREEPAKPAKPERPAPEPLRGRVHPVERLSGRLISDAELLDKAASDVRIKEGQATTTEPAREQRPELRKEPVVPSRKEEPAEPRVRPRFTLEDEKRTPQVREERKRAPEKTEKPEEEKPKVPPPVTAGPRRPEEPPEEDREPGEGRSRVLFSARESRPPTGRPGATGAWRRPEPRKPSPAEAEEAEIEEREPGEEREEAASQEKTEGTGYRRPTGPRGRRQPDRRPRRIRSWDLHRGGLLEAPPVYSTPYDTFVTEERAARKRDSRYRAVEESAREQGLPSADAVPTEFPARWIPIDWDHPTTRFSRPSALMKSWTSRMERIEQERADLRARLVETPRPTGRARVDTGRKRTAGAAEIQEDPMLPVYPVAADSDTSAVTAPGVYWEPEEAEPVKEKPAEAAADKPAERNKAARGARATRKAATPAGKAAADKPTRGSRKAAEAKEEKPEAKSRRGRPAEKKEAEALESKTDKGEKPARARRARKATAAKKPTARTESSGKKAASKESADGRKRPTKSRSTSGTAKTSRAKSSGKSATRNKPAQSASKKSAKTTDSKGTARQRKKPAE